MDTRNRLVRVALQLFWDRGYQATSVADILRTAQVHSGSLYYYFPTKQDLLIAVLDRLHDDMGKMLLQPAWSGVTDPIARVFALLERYRRSLEETDFRIGCPVGNLALEIHDPDPAVREKLATNFGAWAGAVESCLEEAGDRLPADLNRADLALFVLTTMEGSVMLARTHRSLTHFDRSVAQLREYFDRLENDTCARASEAGFVFAASPEPSAICAVDTASEGGEK